MMEEVLKNVKKNFLGGLWKQAVNTTLSSQIHKANRLANCCRFTHLAMFYECKFDNCSVLREIVGSL